MKVRKSWGMGRFCHHGVTVVRRGGVAVARVPAYSALAGSGSRAFHVEWSMVVGGKHFVFAYCGLVVEIQHFNH